MCTYMYLLVIYKLALFLLLDCMLTKQDHDLFIASQLATCSLHVTCICILHVDLKTFVRVNRCQYRGMLICMIWTGLDHDTALLTGERQNHHNHLTRRNKMNLRLSDKQYTNNVQRKGSGRGGGGRGERERLVIV